MSKIKGKQKFYFSRILFSSSSSSSSSSGAEPPLVVGSFALLDDFLPFYSILNTGYPIFDLHMTEILYDVVLPSVLGSSFWSFG
jgi:hypothetical protein